MPIARQTNESFPEGAETNWIEAVIRSDTRFDGAEGASEECRLDSSEPR